MFKIMQTNRELKKRINTLEIENQTLKDKIVNTMLKKFEECDEIKRLKQDNKRLRLKNKQLKEIINEKRFEK